MFSHWRRGLRWLAWIAAALLAVPVLAVAVLLVALNLAPGQRLAERLAGQFTGGMVQVQGLSGGIPWAPRIAHLEVADTRGTWLTIDDLALDWSPLRLLGRDAAISRLAASRIALARLPESQPAGPAKPGRNAPLRLPVRVDLDALHVGRLELAPPIAGMAAAVSIDGAAHLASLTDGDAALTVQRLDGAGSYRVSGRIDAAHIVATVTAQEPPHGLVSGLAGLPDLGALSLNATLDGPWSATGVKLALTAGQLHAAAQGTVDVTGRAADLDVTAGAPAMAPRPDVSWQSVSLDAHVHGPFTKPEAAATLRIDTLAAAGAAIARLAADVRGDAGHLAVQATVTGLTVPGPKPDLLQSSPLVLTAAAQLDAPTRPVTFALTHPLLQAQGSAETAGAMQGQMTLTLPDLAPFAAVGGIDLHGSTVLTAKAAMQGDTTSADIDGRLHITGGMAPVPGLLGDATLGVSAALRGADITLSRLQLEGSTLRLSATGVKAADRLSLDWHLALADLKVLAPTVAGALQGQGKISGTPENFSATADLAGDVAAQGLPRGPVKLSLDATGLPSAPAGRLTAEGVLDRAPLSLVVAAQRGGDGTLHLAIDRADWKSAHAEGALTLPKGATLPQGRVTLRMARLADLEPLLGRPLAGGMTADADLTGPHALRLTLAATDAGLPGTVTVGRLALAAQVADPTTAPVVDARLTAQGLQAGAITGDLQLDAKGPQTALGLRLTAGLHGVGGADADATTTLTVNAKSRQILLAALQGTWKGETLRLLAPARITFSDRVAVDRLRLGLGQAVLEVAGRATPTLDLTASLRNVTPDLAKPAFPGIEADGMLQADARLTGTTARPAGTVRLTATGLHTRTGPGRSLPPASITADATLQGQSARLDARLAAGTTTRLAVTGQAPLGPGPLDLRAVGGVDLAVLDPILSAQGRRVRGQLSLDATATGTAASPRLGGSAELANGEVQDFAQGVHLTGVQAALSANGEAVRITRFAATAGPGTLTASGSVGLAAPMPVDIAITARNARPLASDLVTALLDMDLTVRGQVQGKLAAGGQVLIHRADIQVPETMPPSVAVLDVRVAGAKPPPPPAPGPDIGLDLTLDAPGRIFVRGRGLDAELGGRLHVAGTAARPLPSGGFKLRRGTYSLAGTTLTFSSGEVTFNGASRIDPTLNFIATSTSASVVATLTVGGYASHPTIRLSSVPDLPQDEVLAHLLFGQSAASLSPFQLAEIAAGLAQISGVTGGGDPLNGIRKGLGLDRLSVGSSANPNQTTTASSSRNSTAPAVEAGRYVAPGVYVGAKQGTSGAETQATVQIDIARGLKLETGAGSGQGANNVGVTYEFQY